MTNWQEKADKSEKVLKTLVPKIRNLKAELKVYEHIFNFYDELRIRAQRHTTPVTVLPPSVSYKRPERRADNITTKAKALSYEDRKELIKALEGEIEI